MRTYSKLFKNPSCGPVTKDGGKGRATAPHITTIQEKLPNTRTAAASDLLPGATIHIYSIFAWNGICTEKNVIKGLKNISKTSFA